MIENLGTGDIVTVYFGGATDTGTGEATMLVTEAGEIVTGTGVHRIVQIPHGENRVTLGDDKWEIESDAIHAFNRHGNKENVNLVG